MTTPGIMITNGGRHSAATLAVSAAQQIITIAENPESPHASAARRFEADLIDLLERHHAAIQTLEQGKIAATDASADHFATSEDPTAEVEAVWPEILRLAAGTPFETHFAREDVESHVKSVLGSAFATNKHLERAYFADDNPGHAEAAAYVARYRGAAPQEG